MCYRVEVLPLPGTSRISEDWALNFSVPFLLRFCRVSRPLRAFKEFPLIFVNCTPHALTIEGVGTLPASGIVPRCATVRAQCPDVGGVRVIAQQRGGVTGLPAPVAGTAYIVSGMVLDALWEEGTDRAGIDVFAPDTGADAVRENGQIVAVRGLVC